MALKNYIATADGYVDGRVVKAGEAFTADFRVIEREKPKSDNEVGVIKRDKDGNAVRGELKVPTWAEPIDAKAAAAADAGAGEFADPVFEDMSKSALQAYCAANNIPFEANASKADLVAAAHAQTDYRT